MRIPRWFVCTLKSAQHRGRPASQGQQLGPPARATAHLPVLTDPLWLPAPVFRAAAWILDCNQGLGDYCNKGNPGWFIASSICKVAPVGPRRLVAKRI